MRAAASKPSAFAEIPSVIPESQLHIASPEAHGGEMWEENDEEHLPSDIPGAL